jgi:probable F420-dependent oxidoreductase
VRFTLQYPIAHPGYSPAMLRPDGLRRVVTAAEAAGFDAIAFTEHPAPSAKWMAAGGHDSLDPMTALAWCAAVTHRVRLQPYLTVLPYRNPFLAAKQATTLDLVSGGRLTMAVGVGYLRSEFAALGVDFEERNALFDEALETMRRIWSEDGVAHEGIRFTALAQTSRPRPAQVGGPPMWIGGNGRRARERVAAHGQGWTPLILSESRAATVRTAALRTPDELRRAVDELADLRAEAGRGAEACEIQVEWSETSSVTQQPEETLGRVAELAAAGATWVVVDPPGDDLGRTVDLLAAYGASVIAHARTGPLPVDLQELP